MHLVTLSSGAVGIVVVAALMSFIASAIYNVFFHRLRKIPGPRINAISRIPYARHHLNGTITQNLRKLHDEYGEVVRFSPNEVSFVSNETAWNDIYGFRTGKLKGHANMQKDPVWFPPPPNGVPNIILANDKDHSRGRAILSHAFSEKALAAQESLLQKYSDQFIDGLSETMLTSTEPVDIVQWLNWITFDVIADLLFGEPFGCLQDMKTHKCVELLLSSIMSFRFNYILTYYPWTKYLSNWIIDHKLMTARKEFDEWVAEKTNERCERDVQRADFMTYILQHNDTAKGLSQQELHSNSILFLGAGTETTATLLSAEVRGLWKNNDDLTLDEVKKAPYLAAVLQEGLRYYPPVPTGFPRKVGEGGEVVSGYYLPEGTVACVSSHAAHHSTRNFKDPDSFVPERWLGDERYANDLRDWMQPFSHGPRNCLGKNLAYAEMRLVLAKLIWNFDMELDSRSKDWMDENRVMFVWKKPELLIRLRRVVRDES